MTEQRSNSTNPFKMILTSLVISMMSCLFFLPLKGQQMENRDRIQPWKENPRYWQ